MPTRAHSTRKAASSPPPRNRAAGAAVAGGKPGAGAAKAYAGFRPVAPANAAAEIIKLLNGYLIQHPAQSPAERLAAIKLLHEVKERLRALGPALTAAHLAEAGAHFARKAQSSFAFTPEAPAPAAKPRRAR